MRILFIKDHFSGIKEGEVKDMQIDHANRLINSGYAVAEGVEGEKPNEVKETVVEQLPKANRKPGKKQ